MCDHRHFLPMPIPALPYFLLQNMIHHHSFSTSPFILTVRSAALWSAHLISHLFWGELAAAAVCRRANKINYLFLWAFTPSGRTGGGIKWVSGDGHFLPSSNRRFRLFAPPPPGDGRKLYDFNQQQAERNERTPVNHHQHIGGSARYLLRVLRANLSSFCCSGVVFCVCALWQYIKQNDDDGRRQRRPHTFVESEQNFGGKIKGQAATRSVLGEGVNWNWER